MKFIFHTTGSPEEAWAPRPVGKAAQCHCWGPRFFLSFHFGLLSKQPGSCGPRMIAKGPSIPSTHLVQVIDPSGISRTPGKCSEKVRECWEKDTPIPSTHTRTHTRTHTHTHTPHCPHRCSGLSHFFFRSGQSQVLTAQWCKFSWDKCSFSLWSWTF